MVTRHIVPVEQQADWLQSAESAVAALAIQPGFVSAEIASATDRADLLLITTRWSGVGDYRRALSSYDVKITALPLLYGAVDEPSGFEVLREWVDGQIRRSTAARAFDADEVSPREAAQPTVERRPD